MYCLPGGCVGSGILVVAAHLLSHDQLCDPVDCARQAPRSVGLSGENTAVGAISFSILVNSCSANSCNFSVLMRGSELRVFLFCHLGNSHLQYSLIFLKTKS